MLSNEIRQNFLDFYARNGHTIIPSASLVPVADPTLLLINAGMAPLKRYFMGQEAPPAARCANSQKCVRTIDIDQVGRTNRHNTFFEMLGKWSFGDYFKEEAMRLTLEWYTKELKLDPARLYITHHEKDEETRSLWLKEMGWPEAKLFGLGDKDNLWAAGDTGPWGYDTEYFWDFDPDGQPMDKARFIELCDSGRIVEIGNDVFMEFNRDEAGNVSSLPSRNVDFGGGMERMCMVMQNKRIAFQTDSLSYLVRAFAEVVNSASGHSPDERELFTLGAHGFNPYWLAADHIRTATMLLADGVTPGNVGRNYVLRRLIRRAVAQAYRLGIRRPFIMHMSDLVIDKLGGHYVELKRQRDSMIQPWISKEEEQFFKVVERGYGILADKIEKAIESRQPIAGEFIFELYDTYGFPADLALELCREEGVDVDEAAFHRAMSDQKDRARGAAKFEGDMGEQELELGEVEFTGYRETSSAALVTSAEEVADLRTIAPLIASKDEPQPVPGLRFTTDRTPFYSAGGGQPDDSGWLPAEGHNFPMQTAGTRGVHYVRGVEGELPLLEPGMQVVLAVDVTRRNALRRPHTTNHLMLRALKLVLGAHVNQAGSQLAEDEIRFDFSHFQAITDEEKRRIEALVNQWILEDHKVSWVQMPLLEAKNMGVTAVFDEKYGASVRVVSVGDGDPDDVDSWISRELCGGTHMDHTAQAGSFVIAREESVSSGIRRIYALTGNKALAYYRAALDTTDTLGRHYKRPLPGPIGVRDTEAEYVPQAKAWLEETFGKILDTETKLREAHQSAIEARREMALGSLLPQLQSKALELGGLQVLVAEAQLADRADLKHLVERFAGSQWQASYVVFIGANVDGKAALCCKVSPEALAKGIKAGELIKLAAGIVGGGGGGRDDFAEAGGKDGAKVSEAVAAVLAKVQETLG
ncbi:alanine--tRNA ligase [bacterium]|nr:alanine--tRNA ligase [bacterium]